MKKVIAIMAVLTILMMVLSINQVAASSEDTRLPKRHRVPRQPPRL